MPSQSGKKKASTSKRKTTAKKKTVAKKKTATTKSKKKTTTKQTSTAKKSKTVASDSSGRLRVSQVRSGIGHARVYRRTLTALGLKHHQDVVVVPDNPSVRGMLKKVDHLVSVKPEE
ncbi:MAG: 50S ribosomal protein L30 [Gemmatimonadales bacterium]|jgi:large subunit ribosomal protein L30